MIGVGINSIHLARVLVGGIAWLTADILFYQRYTGLPENYS
jgi:hypothetical protein